MASSAKTDWNAEDAIRYARRHAAAGSLHRCAEYTRNAIEAGGLSLLRHPLAKDYGSSLTRAGFQEVPDTGHYLAGDVVVIQGMQGHEAGHMAIFDGNLWISDFVQHSPNVYPGPLYRKVRPRFAVYRYPSAAVRTQGR